MKVALLRGVSRFGLTELSSYVQQTLLTATLQINVILLLLYHLVYLPLSYSLTLVMQCWSRSMTYDNVVLLLPVEH